MNIKDYVVIYLYEDYRYLYNWMWIIPKSKEKAVFWKIKTNITEKIEYISNFFGAIKTPKWTEYFLIEIALSAIEVVLTFWSM